VRHVFSTVAPTCALALSAAVVLPAFGRGWLALLLAAVALVVAWRTGFVGARHVAPGRERVLIIGRNRIARQLMRAAATRSDLPCTIAGVVDDPLSDPSAACPFPILGPLHELRAIVRTVRPDRIVIGLADRRGLLPVTQLLESRVRGTVIEDASDAYERLTGKLAIEALTPGSLLAAQGFRRSSALEAGQRVLGFTVAAAGLLALAPVLVPVACAIKLDSRGPVFFRQQRVGMAGRPFALIKFRTMHPTERPTSEWARDNLDRVTRVGRWLRTTRLDELPQLFNIVRGDMNLVGPRPHPASNYELFLRNIPYYGLRASVRPGLTGWAQVRYRYANDLQEETEKMRYDLYYIKHMSLAFDLRILLQTVAIVLTGRALAPGQTGAADDRASAGTAARPPARPAAAGGVVPRPAAHQRTAARRRS